LDEAIGSSYQNERRVLKGKLCLDISLMFLKMAVEQEHTVTRDKCIIDTPPSDALPERAILLSYLCACTDNCC
jgi:hypothetical protein